MTPELLLLDKILSKALEEPWEQDVILTHDLIIENKSACVIKIFVESKVAGRHLIIERTASTPITKLDVENIVADVLSRALSKHHLWLANDRKKSRGIIYKKTEIR